jgi:archaellum component FlaC
MSLHSVPKWLEALVVVAEPLVAGRRVVVFGDAGSGLAGHLVRAGARLVHVYDCDGARAEREAVNQSRGVVVRTLSPEVEFDVREGAFELALIPEFQDVRVIADLSAKVRRLVGPAGVCIAATRSSAADAPEYYELYDAVSLQFAHVQMLGLLPFGGLTFAELGENEGKGVSVDTQLLGDVPLPQRFIAIAAQRDTRLDPYTIVQTDTGGASEVMLAELRMRADESNSRGTSFEREAAKLRDELGRVQARAGDNDLRTERLSQNLSRLEEELEQHRARALKLTRELEEERARSRVRIEDVERQLMGAASAIEETEARALRAEAEEQRLSVLAEQAEAKALSYQRELQNQGGGYENELQRFEEVLRDRAKQIQQLEHEIVRRERIVKELLSTLEELGSSQASPEQLVALERQCTALVREVDHQASRAAQLEQRLSAADKALAERGRLLAEAQVEGDSLRGKLDALALETARREGDLQASFWRVAELEGELASRPLADASNAEDVDALASQPSPPSALT